MDSSVSYSTIPIFLIPHSAFRILMPVPQPFHDPRQHRKQTLHIRYAVFPAQRKTDGTFGQDWLNSPGGKDMRHAQGS
jgi:hypothetical protein